MNLWLLPGSVSEKRYWLGLWGVAEMKICAAQDCDEPCRFDFCLEHWNRLKEYSKQTKDRKLIRFAENDTGGPLGYAVAVQKAVNILAKLEGLEPEEEEPLV